MKGCYQSSIFPNRDSEDCKECSLRFSCLPTLNINVSKLPNSLPTEYKIALKLYSARMLTEEKFVIALSRKLGYSEEISKRKYSEIIKNLESEGL